jgi:hypothetical protein
MQTDSGNVEKLEALFTKLEGYGTGTTPLSFKKAVKLVDESEKALALPDI